MLNKFAVLQMYLISKLSVVYIYCECDLFCPLLFEVID